MQLFCTLFASFCLEWLGYYNWGLPSSGKKLQEATLKLLFCQACIVGMLLFLVGKLEQKLCSCKQGLLSSGPYQSIQVYYEGWIISLPAQKVTSIHLAPFKQVHTGPESDISFTNYLTLDMGAKEPQLWVNPFNFGFETFLGSF